MDNIALSVRDLKITYKTVSQINIRRLFSKKKKKSEIFEALKGVSFDVAKGEILGIIGDNGSGKSTLLRALAGIYSPDSGSVETYGQSISLMAIGAGFKKNLSGRDNILLSGLLLGFSQKQIKEKMDEIIEFSGLGAKIDKSVRSYSSGMYSKLAFSITAVLESEIMLIDEILSVGDTNFRRKSYQKMKSLISNQDRTVVIVSHNNDQIRELCSRVLWLHDGQIKMIGKTEEVLDAYDRFMS